MAENHEAHQPMPLVITGEEFFTWPDRPDELECACIKGQFTRNADFTFEVYCVDKPNEDTYKGTRIREMYIMVNAVTVWAWSAPMDDDGDSYQWYMSNEVLVADILANVELIYTYFDTPFAVAWRAFAGQSHSRRFGTVDALRTFLDHRPDDWKELLYIVSYLPL